jgi:hypothetical protein
MVRNLRHALEAAVIGAQGLHVTLSHGHKAPSSPDVDGVLPYKISPPIRWAARPPGAKPQREGGLDPSSGPATP